MVYYIWKVFVLLICVAQKVDILKSIAICITIIVYFIMTYLQFFGELEPTIVWLMDSFYTEHLKDRTEDTLLRPFFGNMDDMGLVLSDSLDRHCP